MQTDPIASLDEVSVEEGTTLILFSNHYPSTKGSDTPFIVNEIGELAAAFGRILVWSFADPGTRDYTTSMPQNVRYMGSLTTKAFERIHRLAISPKMWSGFARLMLDELGSLRIPSARHFLRAVKHGLFTASAATAVIEELKKESADPRKTYLYAYWAMNTGLLVPLLRSYAHRSLVRLHGYDLYEERSGYLPFRRAVFEASDLLLPVSEHGALYLSSMFPDYSPKLSLQRLGTKDWGPGPGGNEEKVRIVSCSSVIALKRVDLIFEVVRRLADSYDLEWVHFGDGPGLEELRREVTLNPHPNLEVQLPGRISNLELMRFYERSPVNLFINLSETEGVPVSIMEAMSFDIPIVATNVGGVAELIMGSPQAGAIVQPSDPVDEAARAGLSILADKGCYSPRVRWQRMAQSSELSDVLIRKILGSV